MLLNQLEEVGLALKRSASPANNVVAVGHKPCRVSGTALEHVEDVPYVADRHGRVAQAQREPEQRGLGIPLGACFRPCARGHNVHV